MPLPSDVAYLNSQKVRAVVNMCREYEGPLELYKKHDIEQLHCPTADLCEPSIEHLQQAVAFIQSHTSAQRRVVVHCKGGRGRAVAVALCYLISQGHDPHQAMDLICAKRSVAARAVLRSPAIKKFILACK